MNQTRGLVLTGGKGPEREALEPWLQGIAMVIAADSGYDLAHRLGVEPDLVVGDFDSIGDREALGEIDRARIKSFPADKDETDTEIAVRLLREHGMEEIVIAGGGGGRLDHLVGILSLFDRADHPTVWLTHTAEVRSIDDTVEIHGVPGDLVSFFPAGCEPCQMRSAGLRWPLDGLTWGKGDAGVSNELVGDSATVEMRSGRLIVVRFRERSSGQQ